MMVRTSGDILQVFVEISPSLPLLNLCLSMSMEIFIGRMTYVKIFSYNIMERHVFPCGGFKHLSFSPLPGEMIQFDSYFSNGLVQPPTHIFHFWYTNKLP